MRRIPAAALAVCLVALAVCLVALADAAEAPLAAARGLLAHYDEDLTRIDRARDLLEASLASGGAADVPTLLTLTRAWFLHGELVARTDEAKLAAFDRGSALARQAIALAPHEADAHLWYAITLGSAAQTRGILRSLLALQTIRAEVDTVLRLDPNSVEGLTMAASLDRELPAVLGGDRARAESLYLKGRALDPHLTGLRVELAVLYLGRKRYADARRELKGILDERTPTDRPRWRLVEVPRARALLESIPDTP
jgi:tetratricopeptide (TPR) repeat protein